MKQLKKILILIISILPFSNQVHCQEYWTFDMYEIVSHNDFRTNELFKQELIEKDIDIPLLDAAIFFATNEIREKKHLSIMKYHKCCEIAAYNHSKRMVEKKFFSHTNKKERKRRTPNDRAKLAGIESPSAWAENIAYNYFDEGDTYLDMADKLLDQWMNSPGHNKNIVDKTNIYIGSGIYPKGEYIYATQFFYRSSNITEKKAVDKLPPLNK